jgi:hypothetical protein
MEPTPALSMSPQLSRHSGPNRLIIKLHVPQLNAWLSDIEKARHYAAAPHYPYPPQNQLQNIAQTPQTQAVELPPVFSSMEVTNF